MTTTPPQDQPAPQEGFGINPRIGAVTLRATTASREDYCPQPSSNSSLAIALITGSASSKFLG